jgi:hypothetical protein
MGASNPLCINTQGGYGSGCGAFAAASGGEEEHTTSIERTKRAFARAVCGLG